MSFVPSILIYSAHSSGTPVVTGCPFPADTVTDDIHGAEIIYDDGCVTESQISELTRKTTGGVKWLELSFLSTQAGSAAVRLIRGKQEDGYLGGMTPGGIALENSSLRVSLNADVSKPPVKIEWQGGAGHFSAPRLTAGGLTVRETENTVRALRILRNGPLRCRAEISGQLFSACGKPSFSYRLSVEIWKSMPALRIDWMLSHGIPSVPEIDVTDAVLDGEWTLGGSVERIFLQSKHTAEYRPRIVRNPGPVTIVADDSGLSAHVSDYEMLLDDSVYPFYCKPGVSGVPPWLQLRGEAGAVCAALKDFIETRPNAFESAGNSLNYFMIPAGQTLKWVQGRRREQNLLLSFSSSESDVSTDEMVRLTDAVFAGGHAVPNPATLSAAKCFDMHLSMLFSPGRNIRLNRLLDSYCNLLTVYSKWDLGDTPDWHYTRIYGACLDQYLPLPGACLPPKRFSSGGGLFPEPAAFMVEPVWTNNEYDIIHAIAGEIMRTGRIEHFNMLRWTVRHNIEVDFIVYSDDPSHHHGSPFHSHFHNTKGAITSHFWTQGLLEYYCLTGDDDALETALALGGKIIEINHSSGRGSWMFDREIGWALLALVSLLDSGYTEFRGEAAEMVDFLCSYDRYPCSAAVKLSGARAGLRLERQMIDCGFGYASMVEAVDKYQRLTNCGRLEAWLIELLNGLKSALWEKVEDGELPTVHNMISMMMAIGFEHTGDIDFLNAGELALQHYLDPAFPLKHPAGGEDGQAKPCAMSHRALVRFLGSLSKTARISDYEYPAILKIRQCGGKTPIASH